MNLYGNDPILYSLCRKPKQGVWSEREGGEGGEGGGGGGGGWRGHGDRQETLSLLAKTFKVVEKTLKELQWE